MEYMIIVKEFTFDSAHNLKWHRGKCKSVHGHTYKLQVAIQGKINDNGIVCDFGALKSIVKEKIIERLDHTFLNDILKNPTAENMCVWIWNQLQADFNMYEVKLWETPTSFAIYRGE